LSFVVEPRPVETCVCAWFYAGLEAGLPPQRDGRVAYRECLVAFPPDLGEEPECAKMRQDVIDLGEEGFARGWEHLLRCHDEGSPEELRRLLRSAFAPALAAGSALRERRRGRC
jgi:hypothetical protein